MSGVPASTSIEPLVVMAGALRMTVDPQLGARILSFSLDGQNILLEAPAVAGTDNANNFGATYWPSPQSAWGWPPVAAIDNQPFSVEPRAQGGLRFESSVGHMLDGSRVMLSKTIVPVVDQTAIDVIYELHNVGEKPVVLAGWQIARVRAGGLTFFRLGEGGVAGDKLDTVTRGGVQWYLYDAAVVVAQGQKTFADAKGWLAHLEGDLLLVQAFPDVLPGAAATGEAEVELYSDPSHTYVELEPQGRVSTIQPGSSGEAWTVRWWLRRVPAGLDVTPGSSALVAFVEDLLQS